MCVLVEGSSSIYSKEYITPRLSWPISDSASRKPAPRKADAKVRLCRAVVLPPSPFPAACIQLLCLGSGLQSAMASWCWVTQARRLGLMKKALVFPEAFR